jgi:hypothetical protein
MPAANTIPFTVRAVHDHILLNHSRIRGSR